MINGRAYQNQSRAPFPNLQRVLNVDLVSDCRKMLQHEDLIDIIIMYSNFNTQKLKTTSPLLLWIIFR